MMALQTSNTSTETPFLRSPSPTPEPAKLSPSLKQPSSSLGQHGALKAVQQQEDQGTRQSPKHKKLGLSSKQRQNLVAGSKRSVTDCLVVVDDSKPDYRDISAAGLQPVVLRPPFSLF